MQTHVHTLHALVSSFHDSPSPRRCVSLVSRCFICVRWLCAQRESTDLLPCVGSPAGLLPPPPIAEEDCVRGRDEMRGDVYGWLQQSSRRRPEWINFSLPRLASSQQQRRVERASWRWHHWERHAHHERSRRATSERRGCDGDKDATDCDGGAEGGSRR